MHLEQSTEAIVCASIETLNSDSIQFNWIRKQNLLKVKSYDLEGNLFCFIIQIISKLIPAAIKHQVEGNALI